MTSRSVRGHDRMNSDTIQVSEYPKIDEPGFAKPRRIPTIDTMKGLSIIMIFYCHFAFMWRSNDWIAFSRVQWLFLDFFGPAMFVTMSMLGNMLGSKKEVSSRKRAPLYSSKSLLKISYLFIIGELINLYTVGGVGISHVFVWNVVSAIAMFSLIMPLITRARVVIRVGVLAIIVLFYFPLLDWSMATINAMGLDPGKVLMTQNTDLPTIVYVLFFQQDMICPLYPWLIVPLVSSIVFEPFINAYRSGEPGRIQGELRRITRAGLIFIFAAIASGFWFIQGYTSDMKDDLKTSGMFFPQPYDAGVPVFLVRNTPQYMFYNFGIICMVFGILADYQLVKGKRIHWEDKINNFGAMSLTAFIFSHASWLFPWIKLQIIPFFAIFIPIIFIVVNLFWFWQKKGKMKFSFEWGMIVYSLTLTRLVAKHGKRQVENSGEGVDLAIE